MSLALAPLTSRAAPAQWCEYTTPAFDILTDLSQAATGELVDKLSRFPPVVSAFVAGAGEGTRGAPLQRPSFIVFRSQREFESTVRPGHFAGFMQSDITGNLIVVGPGRNRNDLHNAALHEYAHHLLRTRGQRGFPLWYEEGLASLTADVVWRRDHVTVRDIPPWRADIAAARRSKDLANVLDARRVDDWSADRLSYFYSASWLLTRYLHLAGKTPGALETYLGDPERGLLDVLDTSALRLNTDLIRYRDRGMPAIWRLEHVAVPAPIPERRCLDDDAVALRISRAVTYHNPGWVLDSMTRLAQAHPDNIAYALRRAIALIHLNEPDAAESALRSLLAAHPDDTDVQIELGNLLVLKCMIRPVDACQPTWREASRLFRAALNEAPTRIDGVYGLGVTYLHIGFAGNGLNYLRGAHRRAPWDVPVNFYLGEGYRIIGDSRARDHLANAYQWASSPLWRERARTALDRLDD